ncbi:MAG: hypothetical protein OXH36_02460 [Bdellovibrionales bacterium]|nr:hypothetical protein [Bdellovibrionales bacterium]
MEPAKSIIHLVHHRSKNRIRDFGEFFTPEKYVNQMLDTKQLWTDEELFEYFDINPKEQKYIKEKVEKWTA